MDHERMHPRLSRIAGIALLLLGISVVLWRVFGSPQDWQGPLGVISLSARLIFPGSEGDAPEEESEKADGSTPAEGP